VFDADTPHRPASGRPIARGRRGRAPLPGHLSLVSSRRRQISAHADGVAALCRKPQLFQFAPQFGVFSGFVPCSSAQCWSSLPALRICCRAASVSFACMKIGIQRMPAGTDIADFGRRLPEWIKRPARMFGAGYLARLTAALSPHRLLLWDRSERRGHTSANPQVGIDYNIRSGVPLPSGKGWLVPHPDERHLR
jgi:hypothetical protein